MRMRALPPLAAVVLGVATAFLVACGGNDGRIPAGDASSLESALDQVSADFDAGKCQAAQQAVTELNGALLKLPDSVDSGLRARLRSGVRNLDSRVQATCTESQTQQQTQTEQQTTTDQQTDTETDTNTDTGTTSTGTTSTGTTSTGTTSTGTTSTNTTTGTTTGGDTTGGTPPGGDG